MLDDVTVTQVAAVEELRAPNPDLAPRALDASALRIGRDHLAATVNTLVLAYVGASLPLLLLFVKGNGSLGGLAASEVVAIAIIRTLVGRIGLVPRRTGHHCADRDGPAPGSLTLDMLDVGPTTSAPP